MGIDDIFNKEEIELISKTTKIENKVYTKDELRFIRSNIIEGIFSKSSKNGNFYKLLMKDISTYYRNQKSKPILAKLK